MGEVARRAGVNVETLRYYERRGLLPEPERTAGGHRSYGADAVRFVRSIKAAQAVGFTLAEIEEYLRLRRGHGAAIRAGAIARIAEVDEKLSALERMRAELVALAGCTCDSVATCTCVAGVLARRGREPDDVDGPLHVTNGESTAASLRRTAIGGAVLPWRDVLHEGPLPAEGFVEARARFLAETGWGQYAALRDELLEQDRRLLEAEQVVLWFEHDLYDQLQLLQILSLRGERAELICIDRFLGGLAPAELEALWPLRRPVTQAQAALARAGWDAVRSPDPTAVERLLAGETSALPFLAAALRRWLEEFPAVGDGLARSERQALEAIEAGARSRAEIFLGVQAREEAPFMGDAWLWRRLDELGPLIGESGLTALGQAVLRGGQDRVRTTGIDRTIGGVVLRGDEIWRWDRDRQRLIPPR